MMKKKEHSSRKPTAPSAIEQETGPKTSIDLEAREIAASVIEWHELEPTEEDYDRGRIQSTEESLQS